MEKHTANASQYRTTDDSAIHAWGPLRRYYRDTLAHALGMTLAFVGGTGHVHVVTE